MLITYYFLFLRVSIEHPYLDTDRFVSIMFHKYRKINDTRNIDVLISVNPSVDQNSCFCEIPSKKNFIYRRYDNFTHKMVSIIGNVNSDVFLISHLTNLGYSICPLILNNSEYIISDNAEVFDGFNEIDKIADGLENRSAFITTNSNFMCNRIIPSFLCAFSFRLFVFSSLLLIIRLFFLFFPLSFRSNFQKTFYTWFISDKGSILTWSKVSHLVKKEQIIRMHSNPSYYELISCKLVEKTHIFEKMCIKNVSSHIYQVFYWIQYAFDNNCDFQITQSGCVFKLDDGDVSFTPKSKIIKNDGVLKVDVPVVIDGFDCNISLKMNESYELPLGSNFLAGVYLEELHLFTLKELLLHKQDSIEEILNKLLNRFDYQSIVIYIIRNGKICNKVSVPRDFDPELAYGIQQEAMGKAKYPFSINKNGSFIDIHRYSIQSVQYIVVFMTKSSMYIHRGCEKQFHSLISIVISYHHRSLDHSSDISLIDRMLNLWSNSGRFAYVECHGKPRDYHMSIGNLFNKPINQHTLKYFVDNMTIPVKWDELSEGKDSFNQFIIPFWMPDMHKEWILVTGKRFIDDLTKDSVFIFMAQTISDFYAFPLISKDDMLSVVFICTLLDVFYVNPDLSIEDYCVFGEKLGYDLPLPHFNQYFRVHDKGKYLSYGQIGSGTINLLRGDGSAELYSIKSNPNQGGFLVFKSPFLQEALSNLVPLSWRPPRNDSMSDFRIYVCDIECDTVFEHRTHLRRVFKSFQRWKAPQQLKRCPIISAKLCEIAGEFYEIDGTLFFNNITEAFGNGKQAFPIRIENELSFDWFICCYQFDGRYFLIHIFNILDEMYNYSLALTVFQSLEASSSYGHVFAWQFEDSETPERVYSIQPSGHSVVVFNWTTVQNNIGAGYRKEFSACIENRYIDMVIPMVFERKKWFLLRGSYDDTNTFNGIALAIPNDAIPLNEYNKGSQHQLLPKLSASLKKLKLHYQMIDISTPEMIIREILD